MAALMLACPSTLVPPSDRVCGVQLPAKCSLPFAVLSCGACRTRRSVLGSWVPCCLWA